MKKLSKPFSLILAVLMIVSCSFVAFAADSAAAQSVSFSQDGSLRIMHITDTHLEDANAEASVWLIAEACDREQPDIVFITGDNVDNVGDPENTKELIDKLMGVFDEHNIPVAVAFGNHDSESEAPDALTREELMAYYNTHSSSVSVDDGDALSGCGTYNIPVMSSDGKNVKFNLWVFDSGDYDSEGRYDCVHSDQVEWYKEKSDELKAANGGEKVNSLVFQHIIVGEIYDALKKANSTTPFAFEHLYNSGEYYTFDPDAVNFGTLNETPCPGYNNYGQFDAMVEKGDVLAMFTGHDHTNAFGVKYKGIDITNSLSTRYNGDAFSTQYGYRIIDVKESDTSVYTTKVVHWFEMFTISDVAALKAEGDDFGYKTALDIMFKGFFQNVFEFIIYRGLANLFTGGRVTYAD